MAKLFYRWKRRALAAVLDATLRFSWANQWLVAVALLSLGRVRLDRVQVSWLSQADLGRRTLRRIRDGVVYPPRRVDGPQRREIVELPEIKEFALTGAVISGLSSSVLLPERKVLLLDGVPDMDQRRYDYSLGHLRRHTNERAIVRIKEPTCIERGIHLAGNGASNYYHWLIEILPRLEFLADPGGIDQDCPLLVNESVLQVPQLREALDLFSGGREVLALDPDGAYLVERLVYISSPNSLPFNLLGRHSFRASDLRMDRSAIDFIRNRVFEALGNSNSGRQFPPRVFLARRELRRSYNRDAVAGTLGRFGFETVYPDSLSFLDQAAMIQQAEAVVGPTGAAWTNLAFARRGTKCICWMAEELGEFAAFSTLAGFYDADLRYLRYKSGTNVTADHYSQDYLLDTRELASALVAMGL